MATKIALAALTVALVGSWGVLPAIACDYAQIKQAAELIKKAEGQSPESKVLLSEARKLLSEASQGEARGKVEAVWQAKTAQDLAAEIAAQPTPQ